MTTASTRMVPPAGNDEALQPAAGRAFTPPEVALMIGVPLLWAILLLFHPGGEGEQVYLELQDQVTAFLVVHLGTMLFIPLMAVVMFLLLRGIEGTAARVSRIALVIFAVFYGAFEALYGIGNGILAHELNGLPQAERATGAELIQAFADNILIRGFGVFVSIGSVALVTGAIAAGVALRRRAGAPASFPVLLGVAAVLITAHPPPWGPIGLALFIVAVLIAVRRPAVSAARSA
jgi:hypothetical protein